MKRDLMAVMACPLCKDKLDLKVGEEDVASEGIDEPSPDSSQDDGLGEPDEVVEGFESGPAGEDK